LEEAPKAYDMFKNKERECIKVVLKPGAKRAVPEGSPATVIP